MRVRAPRLNAPARVALLAWFCVLGARVTNRNAPRNWDRATVSAYLARISAVTTEIAEKGSRDHTNTEVEHKLLEKIKHIIRDFSA